MRGEAAIENSRSRSPSIYRVAADIHDNNAGGAAMSGIFYDPRARRLERVSDGSPRPEWSFVTHNLHASAHQCRRILGEFLPAEALTDLEFGGEQRRR